jgi:hypothetical protein
VFDRSTVVVEADGGRPGVGEEIEKSLAGRQLGDGPADLAVIEEQAGVQVVVQIDQEAVPALPHLQELAALRQLLVLAGIPLPPPHLEHHVLRPDAQHLGDGRDGVVQEPLWGPTMASSWASRSARAVSARCKTRAQRGPRWVAGPTGRRPAGVEAGSPASLP